MKTFRLALIVAVLAVFAVACSKNVKPTTAAAPAAAPATVAPAAPATQPAAPTVSPLDDPNSPLAQLTAHAKYLVANPTQKIRIEGYTDERGTVEYNVALGDRRAQAVRRFMLFQGVNADQITTVSYGEAHPADAGHDETAWSKNRRALIVYLK